MRLSGFFREMAEQICNQYVSRTVSEHSSGLHVLIFFLRPQGSTPQQFCVVSKKCCNLVVEKGIISYVLCSIFFAARAQNEFRQERIVCTAHSILLFPPRQENVPLRLLFWAEFQSPPLPRNCGK